MIPNYITGPKPKTKNYRGTKLKTPK